MWNVSLFSRKIRVGDGFILKDWLVCLLSKESAVVKKTTQTKSNNPFFLLDLCRSIVQWNSDWVISILWRLILQTKPLTKSPMNFSKFGCDKCFSVYTKFANFCKLKCLVAPDSFFHSESKVRNVPQAFQWTKPVTPNPGEKRNRGSRVKVQISIQDHEGGTLFPLLFYSRILVF